MDHEHGTFWERSWKTADRDRLAEYASRLGAGSDPIIGALTARGAGDICDAGCGCGAYARKLAQFGFSVSGFDISADAAALAQALLAECGCATGGFITANILNTPYPDEHFDVVVARDVLDHMPLADAIRAMRELLRITRRGGCVLLTLDAPDAEYETEPHEVNSDGDYLFTGGKWEGMVFHPYTAAELRDLSPEHDFKIIDASGGLTVAIEKGGPSC